MIEVSNLGVSFGDVDALSAVNLTVEPGEVVGLVGPNGAGKSTLLGAINGLVTPTAGTVRIDGDDVATLSARALARRVATVPQETDLSFAFPVREVVAMGRTPYRSRFERISDADRAHTRRAMERTDTLRFAERSIDAVSGGERQRVVFARALCQDPDGLLLDEPTASLDINHQVRLLSLLREFVAEGRAALCAIHDLSLAARFCDRLVLLANGGVLESGSPEVVLSERHVEHAFDTRVAVTHNPVTGTPDVTALADSGERDERVHVLGGGSDAARAIAALAEAGFAVSAGVLPRGDIALETARAHGVETVTADPFTPVDSAVRERAVRLVRHADATVLAGTNGIGHELTRTAGRLVVIGSDEDRSREGVEPVCVVGIESVVSGVEAALDTDRPELDLPAADD